MAGCRWMDGWMDGWLAGWLAAWIDGWIDGRTNRTNKGVKFNIFSYDMLFTGAK
jgi:hypothetical protein